jgi:hypothetical protein
MTKKNLEGEGKAEKQKGSLTNRWESQRGGMIHGPRKVKGQSPG